MCDYVYRYTKSVIPSFGSLGFVSILEESLSIYIQSTSIKQRVIMKHNVSMWMDDRTYKDIPYMI